MNLFLRKQYRDVGALDFEFLYLLSDFRTFGRYLSSFDGKGDFLRAFVDPLLEIGTTLVIPTFSYTASGVFDVRTTPTTVGTLSRWFLTQPGVQRSEHPLFSVAALGPKASLVKNIGKSAFGANSIYERLNSCRAAYLHVGRPVALGNTGVHFVEEKCDAKYRFLKTFPTRVVDASCKIGSDYQAFVRRLDVEGFDFITEFSRAAAAMFQAGVVKEVDQGEPLSNISCYSCSASTDFMIQLYEKDPNIYIEKAFTGTSSFKPRVLEPAISRQKD